MIIRDELLKHFPCNIRHLRQKWLFRNDGVACSSHANGTTKIKGLDRKPRCCQQPFPLRGNEMATCLQISLLYVICRRSGLSPGALGQDFFPIYEKGVWGPNLLHAFFCLTSLRERPDCGYPGVGWGGQAFDALVCPNTGSGSFSSSVCGFSDIPPQSRKTSLPESSSCLRLG